VKKESDRKSSGEKPVESPSQAELIEELKRLDSTLDRLPYSSDLSDMSSYSAAQYQSEFGSWDEALEAANIDKEKELLAELQRVTDELGQKPTQSEMNSLGKYSSTMYARYFGKWSTAKERLDDFEDTESAVSQQPEERENQSQTESEFVWNTSVEQSFSDEQEPPQINEEVEHTTEELLDYLAELEEQFGEPPAEQFVRAYGSYPISSYKKRFKSWNDAMDAANLPSVDWEKRSNRNPTRVEILDELVEYAVEIGEVPEPVDVWNNTDLYAITVSDRFGSITNALNQAGITEDSFDEQSGPSNDVDINISPDSNGVVHELKRVGNPPSDPPSPSDFERESILSMVTVRECFGTWLSALRKAGYNLEAATDGEESTQGYTKKELLEEIRRVTIRIGAVPTSGDFDDLADMTSQTVKNHIGGWELALERAGVSDLDRSEIRELWEEYKLPDPDTLRAEAEWVDDAVAGRTTIADIRTFARYPESYFEEVFDSADDVLDQIQED
jgi:hypothetical protein